MRIMRTATRHNIGPRGEPYRRISSHLRGERPGHTGMWKYHVTKGWRRVRVPLPTIADLHASGMFQRILARMMGSGG